VGGLKSSQLFDGGFRQESNINGGSGKKIISKESLEARIINKM